ncbi:MAG: amidohydrolase family protein [Rhodospirillaceae bacterium]|jgi:predicted TIM-barrel fold metal-dependent hydrolase
MKTIDADAHVIESAKTWSYLGNDEKHFAPLTLNKVSGGDSPQSGPSKSSHYWFSGSHIQPKDNADTTMDEASREMGDVQARLDHMDRLQIDAQVLYPTIFLVPTARDTAQEVAQYKAYNKWLADIWTLSKGRLRWAACVPTSAMHLVEEEMAFAKSHGACCVFMRPFECNRYLGEPYFDPLFRAASNQDLAISIHSGNGSPSDNLFHEGHNFGRFKLAMISTFHWMLENEIPSKYPDLRWAFIEASAAWIPYVLGDVEKRLARKGKKLSDDPLRENNIFVTLELTDNIPAIIDRVGDTNLIIGTDYGHTDTSAQIEALRLLKDSAGINPQSVDRILGPNPKRLYSL